MTSLTPLETPMPATTPLTLPEVARRCGVPVWCVRRLYERGLLPAPPRAGQYRLVHPADLPAIEAALRRAKYLPAPNDTGPVHISGPLTRVMERIASDVVDRLDSGRPEGEESRG